MLFLVSNNEIEIVIVSNRKYRRKISLSTADPSLGNSPQMYMKVLLFFFFFKKKNH